jgi:tyrosyl-tRNA synthetase
VLPGLDGVQRMSKSLGNYIGVTDHPAEMFGKVMSIPDSVLETFWRLTTDANESELADVTRSLADHGENPMVVKKRLAHRLVRMYHTAGAADQAQDYFETVHGRREVPEHMVEEFYEEEVRRHSKNQEAPSIVDFICASGMAATRSAARRLIQQGAVQLDDNPVRAWDEGVDPTTSHVIRAGRKIKRYRPVPG